jgi:serine/threonine protein kinase
LVHQLPGVKTLNPEERRAAQHLLDVLSNRRDGSFLLQATPLRRLLKSRLEKVEPSGVIDAFKRLLRRSPAPQPATTTPAPTAPQQLKLYPTRDQLLASTPAHAWGALDRPITLSGTRTRTRDVVSTPQTEPMSLRLGKMVNWGKVERLEIDGYVLYLSEPFACGSFGSVSYGMDAAGNMLAVKSISLTDMSMRALVYKELQALHRFGQALSPLRALELDNTLYLPMPLMQENAERLLPASSATPAQRAAIAMSILHDVPSICGAMHASKKEAWMHSDIKPENILFDVSGHAWLADFGLATPLNNGMNPETMLSGTLPFFAPEIFLAEKPYAGEAADMWAFGATLLSVATGQDVLRAAFRNTPTTGRQSPESDYAHAMGVFLDWQNAYVMGENAESSDLKFSVLNQFMRKVNESLGPGLFGLIVDEMLHPDPEKRITFARLTEFFVEGRDYKILDIPHSAPWRSATRQHIEQVTQKTEPLLGNVARFLADRHGDVSPRINPTS